MKKHVKIFMDHYGYDTSDFIPCFVCSRQAVDIHHINYGRGNRKDEIGNLIALCRDCHNKAHFKKEPYIHKEELFAIVTKRI